MGHFEQAIKTCGEYLKPIKKATLNMKKLELSVKQKKLEFKMKEEEDKHLQDQEEMKFGRRYQESKLTRVKTRQFHKHSL